MTDERGWALLDAYLANECSSSDGEAMRYWLEQTPAAAAVARTLQGVSVHSDVDQVPFDENLIFQRISNLLPAIQPSLPEPVSEAPPVRERSPRPGPSQLRSRTVMWGAVCAVVGVMFGLFGHRIGVPWISPEIQREYSTTRGQQINITLDDKTQVWLAPDTRLQYTQAGRNGQRTVTLNGEAVFQVQHADRAPFVVRSAGVDVRVLGTTFGVRSYPEDSAVRVAIQDGKVAVKNRVLTAGDIAWASGSKAEVRVQNHQPISTLTGWRSGQLVFIGMRLDEVLPSLARWYDLEFVLADPKLAERRVSATLDPAQLTTEDLDFLSVSLGVRYLRIGRTITFYPQMP